MKRSNRRALISRGIRRNMNENCNKENKARITTKEVTICALLIALALIFSYIEKLLSLDFAIPGIKLGLCNLVILCAIYLLGPKLALVISVARIFLVGFLFGNMFAVIYSLAGGLLSLLVMVLLHRYTKLSVVTISCMGGICHNVGQIMMAVLVVENLNLFFYLPILLVAGFITGLIIGIICKLILPAIAASAYSKLS